MNILMLYPEFPDTFWGFKHALRFISKKVAMPPLGLLTVSAMFPEHWNKKLVDTNIESLKTDHIHWADYVFISAMHVQKKSVDRLLDECVKQKAKIVAGGPLFTQDFEDYPQIDHFVLNEAEITFPLFIKDIERRRTPQKVYKTDQYANITSSPVPDYHLLTQKAYAFMSIQVSRGCPFSCDFCEITALLGHKVRMKSIPQIIHELENLYQLHWRGPVSIVDDNFIGNKYVVKHELLPAMQQWMIQHHYPFTFNIQSSINLADDPELLSLLTHAGFNSAFIGIETPEEISLKECNKLQNRKRDLLENVKTIQKAGLQISGGFIVGFDTDLPTVFQRQIDFIQQSGIVSAMVGLLNAPKKTRLYNRLKSENRITIDFSGDNTDSTMNFIPKMNTSVLLSGYEDLLERIYGIKPYYKRIRQFLSNYKPKLKQHKHINFSYLAAFIKTMIIIGILHKGQYEYWKLLLWTLIKKPALMMEAVTYTVYGYHFRKIYNIH